MQCEIVLAKEQVPPLLAPSTVRWTFWWLVRAPDNLRNTVLMRRHLLTVEHPSTQSAGNVSDRKILPRTLFQEMTSWDDCKERLLWSPEPAA